MVLVSAVVVLPRANSILTNADNTVNELSAVVDELQQVDFIAMSEGHYRATKGRQREPDRRHGRAYKDHAAAAIHRL